MTAFTMLKPGHSSRRVDQLRGPRPSPLMLQEASHAIKKSSPMKPVVIHMVSPKVIHVRPGEFMSLVQRLTGAGSPTPPSPATVAAGDEAPGNGSELPGRGSPATVEAIRAPSRRVPITEVTSAASVRCQPARPSEQLASWHDFFVGQSSSGSVSSSGHVLASSGPYAGISCLVSREN